ncbi:hypothetical protein ACFSTC_56960 [Nonomuraea ferruginea]
MQGVYRDDHGGWAFETVIAESAERLAAVCANGESDELRWLPLGEVAARELHPGFAETWGTVSGAISPETLVLDVANIVGARAERGWWNDRLGAATRLLEAVSGLRLSHSVLAQWYPRMVAVVEGAAREVPDIPGMQVVAAARQRRRRDRGRGAPGQAVGAGARRHRRPGAEGAGRRAGGRDGGTQVAAVTAARVTRRRRRP